MSIKLKMTIIPVQRVWFVRERETHMLHNHKNERESCPRSDCFTKKFIFRSSIILRVQNTYPKKQTDRLMAWCHSVRALRTFESLLRITYTYHSGFSVEEPALAPLLLLVLRLTRSQCFHYVTRCSGPTSPTPPQHH